MISLNSENHLLLQKALKEVNMQTPRIHTQSMTDIAQVDKGAFKTRILVSNTVKFPLIEETIHQDEF